MKVKYIMNGIGLLLAICLLGCQNFLEKKSDARLLVPKTLADLQGIMDDFVQMNVNGSPSYGQSSCDDFFIPETLLSPLSQFARDQYCWKKFDYLYPNDWSKSYLPIYNANLVLELLEKVERNAANARDWDNVKGSALFYRSFYNFLLTGQHGLAYDEAASDVDPGIVLRLSADFNVQSVRSSVSECLKQSIADAQVAALLLPNDPVVSLRPSKAAAYGQLARIYLYMRNYNEALRYAEECLKLKSTLMDFNGDGDLLGLDLPVSFRKFNKETIFYSEMNDAFAPLSSSFAKIDPLLLASFDSNDLRRRAYFMLNGSFYHFKGNYSSSGVLFSGIATDEMYLIRSESKAKTGNIAGAMQDLNFLLQKRWRNTVSYNPIVALDQAEALVKIRAERRKELLMRGLRWLDLKRYNKEGAGIRLERTFRGEVFRLEPNAPFYALPLPKDILELAGIPQN